MNNKDQQVQKFEMSSESEPQQIDLDELNEITVQQKDIQQLSQLMATTKPLDQKENIFKKQVHGGQIDLFLRNFFIRYKMTETLNNFQQQWHQLGQKGMINNENYNVPEEYIQSQIMQDQIRRLKEQLDKAVIMAQKARRTYQKLFKQRNFHKMHHQRVQQEKKKLNVELEKLRNNHLIFENKYDQQAEKYSHLMKQKMLVKLERDRLYTRAQFQKQSSNEVKIEDEIVKENKTKEKIKYTPFPPDQRQNPYANQNMVRKQYHNLQVYKTWRVHNMAVTSLSMHPKKPFMATSSDDLSWKVVRVPQGELLMSGQGHRQWVSAVKFHPIGSHLITSSGDCTIKVWDFVKNINCTHTFTDHSQAVWDITFHDTGDFFASASLDHLAKIFDLNVGKCRHSLRGHVDSVNAVHFQPYSNLLATASADKTVSLWDLKTSLCVQTFYGHNNSVNDTYFNKVGDKLASCDADGIVKIWDVRMVKQKSHYDSGKFACNTIHFDPSGNLLAIGCDDGQIKLFNDELQKTQDILKGHQGSIQQVMFDNNDSTIYSCGNDCTFRIWQ